MKKRLSIAVAAATVALSIASSCASAATEFGSGCAANAGYPIGQFSVGHGELNPLPVAAPISGVVTEWTVNVATIASREETDPPTLYQELYVVRQAAGDQFLVVGKAESGVIPQNAKTSFKTRIPIQQGDFLGLTGDGQGAVYCANEGHADHGDRTFEFYGLPAVGSTFTRAPKQDQPLAEQQVPVTAKIEPDVDGDGYGDETQDGCPQSALSHESCPVVAIGSHPIAGVKAIYLNVSTSLTSSVTVSADVALGKGRQATLTVPTQTASAGSLSTFVLALPPSVTKVLRSLPMSRTLPMSITASAANFVGAPSVSVTAAKLKGRRKVGQKHAAPDGKRR